MTFHVSPLRMRLKTLAQQYPAHGAGGIEDWLLDLANARGARIVTRAPAPPRPLLPPTPETFSNEELVVAICHLAGADRPQMLRVAAQLISRGRLDLRLLIRHATRERAGSVLIAMAQEALKVAPEHPVWRGLADAFASAHRPHDAVIHWSRLAEPVMANGRCNAASWRLVA